MDDQDVLKREVFENRLNFSKHEAVCQARYEQLIKNMEHMARCMEDMKDEINVLKEMAITGRVSLRTLLWVGSVTGTLIGVAMGIINYIK